MKGTVKYKEKKSYLNKLFKFDSLIAKKFTNYNFIGIDEVGRGALAGPVIACAFTWKDDLLPVALKNKTLILNLNDSKQLTKDQRKKLFKLLTRFGIYSLGYASVQEIEKLNILNATYLAMKRAFDDLVETPQRGVSTLEPYVLIDGNKFNPYINCRQSSIIKGDAKSSLIASASIIAKEYRDMLMKKIAKIKKYKNFGWSSNVGYGTSFHRNAIKENGLTPFHRKMFVRKTLANLGN